MFVYGGSLHSMCLLLTQILHGETNVQVKQMFVIDTKQVDVHTISML